MIIRTVLFDVDYTLLKPGDVFQAQGYRRNGEEFGLRLDPARWPLAVRAAAQVVWAHRARDGHEHDMELIPAVTRAIVDQLAGDELIPETAAAREACARHVAQEWWRLENYSLYDDVLPCFSALHAAGLRIGLVSNTSRSLGEVVSRFGLTEYVDACLASADIGVMKPDPAIFTAALQELSAVAAQTAMVGDSLHDDVHGALAAGLGLAVLLDRGDLDETPGTQRRHEPTIASLRQLPPLLGSSGDR